MCNLTHRYKDFHMETSWTFSASGHGKGPHDGIGAVVKSIATNYLLKGGPNASFSSPKQFYEWCFQKNDRMVMGRSRRMEASSYTSSHILEPNRPIEVRWLPADQRCNRYREPAGPVRSGLEFLTGRLRRVLSDRPV